MIFDGRRDLSAGAFPFMVRQWQRKIALTIIEDRCLNFPMLVIVGRLLRDGWITFAKGKNNGNQL